MPYADNKGIKIFYDTYGTGTPIVFLHPWTTNGYIWYYQIFPFARTNHCIAVDHRSHDHSNKPKTWYSIQKHTNDVGAVFDAAKIDKAVLVGNSIGGMIRFSSRSITPIMCSATSSSAAAPPFPARPRFRREGARRFHDRRISN